MRYLLPEPPVSADNYAAEDGVVLDPGSEIQRTCHTDARYLRVEAPELRTRGVGCPLDNVDTSVRVRYTQPRRTA